MFIKRKFFLLIFFLVFASPSLDVSASVSEWNPTLDAILKRYAIKRDLSDWEALVLGLNGVAIKPPLFSTHYLRRVERDVKRNDGQYRIVTDYARIALVWKSHGRDMRNIAGYDFAKAIAEFPNKQNQGINAYIWALIALYGYEDETEGLAVSIMAYQRPSGGFSVSLPSVVRPDPSADADLTAMAVVALSPYRADPSIAQAVALALDYLSNEQLPSGGFRSAHANGAENAETLSQVIIAVCAAGFAVDDPLFVKKGATLLDALNRYRLPGDGYAHGLDGDRSPDPISTQQAALALTAVRHAQRYDAMDGEERIATGMRRGMFEF